MHQALIKFGLSVILLIVGFSSVLGQKKIGIFDNNTDIGQPKHKGFASYSEEDQVYTIGGSGENMWFGKDEFHFLWTTLQGDFILRAEFEFLGKGVNTHRKVGWIVKNDLGSTTPHVNASVHGGDGLTSLQYRTSDKGDTKESASKDTFPDVIQLERRGERFIMSTAKFGEPFTEVQITNEAIQNQVYVGLYVCSHDPDIMEVAKFRNVRIVRPADPDFVPYQDYIGSRLEVMEVATGHRKILFSTTNSIQAPNWTVDGERLIYNTEGRLCNYGLSNGQISSLESGFAINNNNDHVLSFDGQYIAISDHDPNEDYKSAIYYFSVEGDTLPKRVTKPGSGESYLHGWSPDNKTMIFTGNRNDQYDIYAVDVASGKEKQLTNQKTLDDGSEYSPDGKTIFFNSARTGKMKIWKMDANGKNQVQLTSDDYNDWFPHVSPDQKWIVFLSYPKDIEAGDHPFYKHCLIRIMPFEGGTPKVIGYIYGGQGSINVPSWSPDSKYISFVTNTRL